jgi:hypothetical protein
MSEDCEDTPCSLTPATGPTPTIDPSLLTDILIAWAEAELSEEATSEITGMDRITLRGLKQDAIDRAIAYADPILESNARTTLLAMLDRQTPEKREEFFALRPEWRCIYQQASRHLPTKDGPSSGLGGRDHETRS